MSAPEREQTPEQQAMLAERPNAIAWMARQVDDPERYELEAAADAVEAYAEDHSAAHPRAMMRDWAWVRTHEYEVAEALGAMGIPGPRGARWLTLFEQPRRWHEIVLRQQRFPRRRGEPVPPTWLAEITGTSEGYGGWARKFVDGRLDDRVWSRSYWVAAGTVFQAGEVGVRRFLRIDGEGREERLTEEQVRDLLGAGGAA